MAIYETRIRIPVPVPEAFAYVSDFSNAANWDPRTYSAEQITSGPIGVGTCFELAGGILRKEQLRRLHVPTSAAGMKLPYNVVEFTPTGRFVLEGESRMLWWRDELDFSPDAEGTQLHYFAELRLKGRLQSFEARLQKKFQQIGDDATRDLSATVAAGV